MNIDMDMDMDMDMEIDMEIRCCLQQYDHICCMLFPPQGRYALKQNHQSLRCVSAAQKDLTLEHTIDLHPYEKLISNSVTL